MGITGENEMTTTIFMQETTQDHLGDTSDMTDDQIVHLIAMYDKYIENALRVEYPGCEFEYQTDGFARPYIVDDKCKYPLDDDETSDEIENIVIEAVNNFWAETVINDAGYCLNFPAAVDLMDDDLREKLNNQQSWPSSQVYFEAYETAHRVKFDEVWELSKANPVW